MCQQLRPQTTIPKVKGHNNVHLYDKILWPLPIPVAILLLSLLPSSFYLNRGYTVWFHLLSIIYLLTKSTFIRKVLILQGIGICLGWYAAIATDWFVDNTFCHTLYRNMPESIMFYMIKEDESESSYIILNTYTAMSMKILSHVLDTLGHPGLAYLFYRIHSNEFRRTNDNSRSIWRDILSWEVIVSAWHLSRIWSMVHSYYNFGEVKLWYYGFHVYKLNSLNSYFIAYVVEGLCFVVAILYRLHWDRNDSDTEKNICIENIVSVEDKPPKLVHSESAVSTTSLM